MTDDEWLLDELQLFGCDDDDGKILVTAFTLVLSYSLVISGSFHRLVQAKTSIACSFLIRHSVTSIGLNTESIPLYYLTAAYISRSMKTRISVLYETLVTNPKSLPGRRGRMTNVTRTPAALFMFLWISNYANVARAYPTCCPRVMFGMVHSHRSSGRESGSASRPLSPRRERLGRIRSSEFDSEESDNLSEIERNLMERISRLEAMVSKQEVEIYRLRKENEELKAASEAFAKVLEILREASLRESDGSSQQNSETDGTAELKTGPASRVVESFDDSMIFGTAPTSVNDAADAAGAAILAAVLGGKQRMLVDVRDAELSSDPETLVQFIELAILPIAAGLEGLKSTRNRVKIVFPKVSQLLEYRRTMALAAPEVVALSTLGFDPVERRDKLVVIVAPQPDDEEGLLSMSELLYPSDGGPSIEQPVVILNYHMVPVSLPTQDFETAYHLRLLSVQYMTGATANEMLQAQTAAENDMSESQTTGSLEVQEGPEMEELQAEPSAETMEEAFKEKQLEAAMKHAHEIGLNIGVTRAMVIRRYPR